MRIMFQGGFAGSEMVCYQGCSEQALQEVARFEADDNNEWQEFIFPEILEAGTEVVRTCNLMKIVFPRSSDFYGRVTVYRLEVFGARL